MLKSRQTNSVKLVEKQKEIISNKPTINRN